MLFYLFLIVRSRKYCKPKPFKSIYFAHKAIPSGETYLKFAGI
jgi:hypothetical protein